MQKKKKEKVHVNKYKYKAKTQSVTTTSTTVIPGGAEMFEYVFPEGVGRRVEKVRSLASTQALIEVQLRLHHYKQLYWRHVLPVLEAELRVRRSHTWALLFHVCHRWQPERHIPASTFWKCVWLHEIFISFPALQQCAYLFTRFSFFFFFYDSDDWFIEEMERKEGLSIFPSTQPLMGGVKVER